VVRNTNVVKGVALKSAVEAANATGKKNSTIVADWTEATWQGLKSK
jgi:hypothetical protein